MANFPAASQSGPWRKSRNRVRSISPIEFSNKRRAKLGVIIKEAGVAAAWAGRANIAHRRSCPSISD